MKGKEDTAIRFHAAFQNVSACAIELYLSVNVLNIFNAVHIALQVHALQINLNTDHGFAFV